MEKLTELIKDINDITFLKQIASNLFMKLTLNNPKRSSIELTEWLMLIENSQSLTDLKNLVIDKVKDDPARTRHRSDGQRHDPADL